MSVTLYLGIDVDKVQLALFIAALDQTIMATSIPTICAQLHSASGYVWIGGAYLLANAAASDCCPKEPRAPSIAPSERSNIGLPGRYRPVSQAPPPMPTMDPLRKSSTMSGALGAWDQTRKQTNRSPHQKSGGNSDDDDEEGWEAMKAKREKKKSMWKSKKSMGSEIGALIS